MLKVASSPLSAHSLPLDSLSADSLSAHPPELWVGPEASFVRVGDRRTDQLSSTGFAHRIDDVDRLAAVGAVRIRMPLLWERTETASGEFDFGWADTRMQRARELGLD